MSLEQLVELTVEFKGTANQKARSFLNQLARLGNTAVWAFAIFLRDQTEEWITKELGEQLATHLSQGV